MHRLHADSVPQSFVGLLADYAFYNTRVLELGLNTLPYNSLANFQCMFCCRTSPGSGHISNGVSWLNFQLVAHPRMSVKYFLGIQVRV